MNHDDHLDIDLDPDGMAEQCQPGCDHGYHLPGCVYAEVDAEPVGGQPA